MFGCHRESLVLSPSLYGEAKEVTLNTVVLLREEHSDESLMLDLAGLFLILDHC